MRANTSIPGMGEAITAVDVTFDGKWILATTDRHLMVVKVRPQQGGGIIRPPL